MGLAEISMVIDDRIRSDALPPRFKFLGGYV